MAVKTYLTVRPMRWAGAWMTPKHLLTHSFTGMPLEFRQMVWSPAADGRMLLEIVADTTGHLDAVVEAMSWFGQHQKTLGSARSFAEQITGLPWVLTGDPDATTCDPDLGEGVSPPPIPAP